MSKKEYEIWGEGQKVSNIDFEDLTAAHEETLKKAQDRIIKAINRNIRVAKQNIYTYTATPYSIINQFLRTVIIDLKNLT